METRLVKNSFKNKKKCFRIPSLHLFKDALPFFDQAVNYEVTLVSCLDTILSSLQNLWKTAQQSFQKYTDRSLYITCVANLFQTQASSFF